jgi:hypothetical protein
MKKDIVTQLRKEISKRDRPYPVELLPELNEAADEIERLRNELTERIHMCDMRSEKIIELTAERDEARREVCFVISEYDLENGISTSPKNIAIEYEWDCFKDIQNGR